VIETVGTELFNVVKENAEPRVRLMKPNVNTLERAFELARTGGFDSIRQLKDRLDHEGYLSNLVIGRYLSAQLKDLMRMADPVSYSLRADQARDQDLAAGAIEDGQGECADLLKSGGELVGRR
jgi:hypothetical protein